MLRAARLARGRRGSRAAGADASFRSLDGSGNSAANPQSNAVNTPFLARPRYYADGLSSIDAALPNARAVSNALFAQAPFRFNSYSVSSLAAAWGQFVAHDMVMTSAHPNASGADVVRIAVPAGDADMDPDAAARSRRAPGVGDRHGARAGRAQLPRGPAQ